jgi:hypothetical protein
MGDASRTGDTSVPWVEETGAGRWNTKGRQGREIFAQKLGDRAGLLLEKTSPAQVLYQQT